MKTCLDFDEDCEDVESPTRCWMYQPERGRCPYLVSSGERFVEPPGDGGGDGVGETEGDQQHRDLGGI